MRFVALSLLFILLSCYSLAQEANDIRVGINADLIKSDNDGFFEKVQASAEVNYYLHPQFTATGGVEWWTGDQFSLVLGTRWCPIEEAFVRVRGLIGQQEFSLGAGFSKPFRKNFQFEAMGDLYFSGHVAIRAGIAYVIK